MSDNENSVVFERVIDNFEEYFMGPPMGQSDAALINELEHKLHYGSTGKRQWRNPRGLDGWSKNHSENVPHMGKLPYWPEFFKDQRVDVPNRSIGRLSKLPDKYYLKSFEYFYAKAVGSRALANSIIETFDTTPAFPEEGSLSLTEYAIDCLKNDISFGVVSGHADRLSDIADFTGGISLAVARREGKKYLDNFRLLVNTNMTRETYRGIPIAWLISVAMGAYWGLPPGESIGEYDIPKDVMDYVNKILIDCYRSERKLGAVVLGSVPAGARMVKVFNKNTDALEQMDFKDCYTGSFMTRCEGGVIPTNRVEDRIEIGPVIKVDKNKNVLTDRVMQVLAGQVVRLANVPVGYKALSGENAGQQVILRPAHSKESVAV